METFYEYFLTEDFSTKRKYMKIVQTIILTIVAGTYIMLGSIIITGLVGILYLITILISNYYFIEYEYALTNNELDIAKITNKSRRKNICTIDISKVSKVSILGSNNDGQVKYKKCYVGNENLKTIGITVPSNGEVKNYSLRVDEKLLSLFKRINPSKFNI
ncbi:MAG: DUF6106 family protein [Clostridium sp.]